MFALLTTLLALPVSSLARYPDTEPPLLLIIGFDGLRYDYINSTSTPNLYRLAQLGTWADQGMTPIFPAKTIPNFYAISTGLFAESHGIISNTFFDPKEIDNYTKASTDSKWYNGVPIWAANDRLPRHRTGCMRWPGCDASIAGSAAVFTTPFLEGFSGLGNWSEQMDTLVQWFNHPDTPINLGMFFISEPDETEHYFDITGLVVRSKINEIDRFVGYMLTSINNSSRLKDHLNIIILSDHGHVNVHNPRDTINLKDYIPQDQWNLFYKNGYSFMPKPKTSQEDIRKFHDDLVAAKKRDHLKYTVYWKKDMPERFHYKNSPRIGPILVVPDLATNVTYRDTIPAQKLVIGQHGYDNEHWTQRGSFVAYGPAFKSGRKVPVFSNVHVYPAVSYVLGVYPAAPCNGSITVLWPYLVKGQNAGVGARTSKTIPPALFWTAMLFLWNCF